MSNKIILWSNEQKDIFNAWEHTQDNLIINAAPGSGKTTVLSELYNMQQESILSIAFNKAIVQELESRLGEKPYSKIATFNSLGYQACRKAFPKAKMEINKVLKIIDKEMMYKWSEKEQKERKFLLKKVVDYAKSNLLSGDVNEESIAELVDFYDLDSYPGIEQDCIEIYHKSLRDTQLLDFADQLLMPVRYNLKFPEYESILVDESQDLNALQAAMLSMILSYNSQSRIALVGDSHQAIYAFRGALSDSMELLKERFSCKTLPLTISRRCARAIVELAQNIFPDDINAADNAKEGLVRDCENRASLDTSLKPYMRDFSDVIEQEMFSQDDFILARTNAVLVRFAMQMLRQGKPCYVKGRELGESLSRYIKKSKHEYMSDFMSYFQDDLQQQIDIAMQRDQESKVSALHDKKETLEVLCENIRSNYVSDLLVYLDSLFSQGKGTMLSSVHKAKGLESDKVYLLCPDSFPHALARKDWQIEQEKNILYVAVTRAKNELVYV